MPPHLLHRLQQFFTLLLLGISLLTIFPPQVTWALWWNKHAVWVSFSLLLLGLLFFVVGWLQQAFVCFGYAAAISFWLYETGQGDAPLAPVH